MQDYHEQNSQIYNPSGDSYFLAFLSVFYKTRAYHRERLDYLAAIALFLRAFFRIWVDVELAHHFV